MCVAGEYVIQHHSQGCTLDTMLATAGECSKAKAALDPDEPPVEPDDDTAANVLVGKGSGTSTTTLRASLTVKASRFVDQIKQVALNATTLKNTLTIYHKNFAASICVQ